MCINMENEHPGPDTKTDTELGKVSGPRVHAPDTEGHHKANGITPEQCVHSGIGKEKA